MGSGSREKGKRGEREAAELLTRVLGIPIHRTQQYNGRHGDSDLKGIPGVSIEVKRRARRQDLYAWLDQCEEDLKEGDLPLIIHRTDNNEWLVTMDAEDLLTISARILVAHSEPDVGDYIQRKNAENLRPGSLPPPHPQDHEARDKAIGSEG